MPTFNNNAVLNQNSGGSVPTALVRLAAGLVLLAATSTAADDSQFRLFRAKSLKCKFARGTVGEWKGGKLKLSNDSSPMAVHFDSIDLSSQKARVIGNVGADDVSVFRFQDGLTFIEHIPAGMVFDTVFANAQIEGGEYAAVESRHTTTLTTALPSQYYGACKVWE